MSTCAWCFVIGHYGQLLTLTQLYMSSSFQFGISGEGSITDDGDVLKWSEVSFGGCGGVIFLIDALALVVHANS